MSKDNLPALDKMDYAANAIQAIIKGIPHAGSSLEQFIFGPLQEKRLRRIEQMLHEIAERLGEKEAQKMVTEEFVTLLEEVAPALSRSIGVNKRDRFRDLLFNAAKSCSDQRLWEEANLASSFLQEIDEPGLSLLASIARTKKDHPVILTSIPSPQIVIGDFNFDNPVESQHKIPYQWPIVEYWARKLQEKGIITYGAYNAKGGLEVVRLGYMGEFLVQWVLSE